MIVTDLYVRREDASSALRDLPVKSCLRGARPKGETIAWLKEAGFRIDLWEDHSDLLKQLAAKFVFEQGSIEDFRALFAPGCAGDGLSCNVKAAKPGYYLLVAGMRNGTDG